MIFAFGFCSVSLGCAPETPKNVLLVTIDTLRADRTGPYGFGLARTPHMDRLAREGATFETAIATAPITLVAHSTIFTGLLPPAHGVRDNGAYSLGAGATTLAESLQSAGFETRAFVSALVLNRRYGLAQGFESYDDDLWSEDQPKMFLIRDRPAQRTAERFLEWLRARPEAGAKPFFAWVHFFDPHQPYAAAGRFAALAPHPYDAEIAAADDGLGRLLAGLAERGELDSTLVIVTADHGESLGEHDEKTHAIFIYDATVHIPLILRAPGLVPPGLRVKTPVHQVDLMPTVLSALGLPGGEKTQGLDLGPLLRGGTLPERALYGESLLSEIGFGMAPLYSARADGFKWIRAPRPELYDLTEDPRELRNLAGEERRRSRELDRRLDELLADSAERAIAADQQVMDKETLETLQALGYLAPRDQRAAVAGMDPKDGIVFYSGLEEARHAAQRGDWDEAAARCRKILTALPGNQSALNILGLAELRRGDLAAARDAYYRSLALEPRQSRVFAMLGSIALIEGRLDEADDQYRKALEITPEFVEAMVQRGLIAAVQGDESTALGWYQKAQAADPGFPRAWRLAGDHHYERGEFAPALAAYERALEISGKDLHSLIQAGNAARRLGRPADAAKYFERAADTRPDSWLPRYNLACLEALAGRAAAAQGHLDAALERGFQNLALARGDADLAGLRARPEFQRWLTTVDRQSRRAGDDGAGDGR
ncbi:MAG: sulfatase-like hydrolase/transferase [Thermoanaerobaculia bacterium]|nr:sulfatase-like hydrolase/transferase [Thermoanaerobaculia bacterium]